MNSCYFCGAKIEPHVIDHMAQGAKGYVLVKDLPVLRCTQCHEVYLDTAASRLLDTTTELAVKADESIVVPVIHAT